MIIAYFSLSICLSTVHFYCKANKVLFEKCQDIFLGMNIFHFIVSGRKRLIHGKAKTMIRVKTIGT